MDLKLCGKYKLREKQGAEAFVEVFIGKENTTGEDAAVKIENNRTRHQQLLHKIDNGKWGLSTRKSICLFAFMIF